MSHKSRASGRVQSRPLNRSGVIAGVMGAVLQDGRTDGRWCGGVSCEPSGSVCVALNALAGFKSLTVTREISLSAVPSIKSENTHVCLFNTCIFNANACKDVCI